ncbi:MAG: hypothetical protein ACI8ZO_001211 [Flavobacteriales bacterium]|jgi:hypothetical protein
MKTFIVALSAILSLNSFAQESKSIKNLNTIQQIQRGYNSAMNSAKLKSTFQYQCDSVISYNFVEGTNQWQPRTKETFINFDGERFEGGYYSWNQNTGSYNLLSNIKYSFNGNQQLERQEVYCEGELLCYTFSLEYNTNNRLTKETVKEASSSGVLEIDEIKSYTYNNNNQLEKITFSGYSAATQKETPNSNLFFYYTNGNLDSIHSLVYDFELEEWQAVARVIVDQSPNLETWTIAIYNQDSGAYDLPEDKYEYQLDGIGNHIDCKWFFWSDDLSEWQLDRQYTFSHDQNKLMSDVFSIPMNRNLMVDNYEWDLFGHQNAVNNYTKYRIEENELAPYRKYEVFYSDYNPLNIENDRRHNLNIYPNPTLDVLKIEGLTASKISFIKLYDMLGNIQLIKEINTSSLSLNISNLNSGVYFLNIEQDGANTVRKIIKH